MEFGTIGSVVGITVICYLAALGIKATPLDNKWLPPICIVLGGVLGVVARSVAPELIPANDILSAIAVGIVSGGFATTVHQTIKQQANGQIG